MREENKKLSCQHKASVVVNYQILFVELAPSAAVIRLGGYTACETWLKRGSAVLSKRWVTKIYSTTKLEWIDFAAVQE